MTLKHVCSISVIINCGPAAAYLPTIDSPGYTWCPDFGFYYSLLFLVGMLIPCLRAVEQNKTNWNGSGISCCQKPSMFLRMLGVVLK